MTERPNSKRPPPSSGHSDDADATPQEIVRDIAQTRAEMSETIAAIEQRLNPTDLREKAVEELNVLEEKVKVAVKEQLEDVKIAVKEQVGETIRDVKVAVQEQLDETTNKVKANLIEAKDAFKQEVRESFAEAKQAVHDATIGKVTTMAREASDTMIQTGDTMMDTVRRNPIPAALVGVGLAWLFMNRSSGPRRVQYRELRSGGSSGGSGRSGSSGGGYYLDAQGRPFASRGGYDSNSRGYDSNSHGGFESSARGDGGNRSEQDFRGEHGGVSETLSHAKDSAGRLIDRAQSAVNAAAHDVRDAAGNLAHQVSDTAGGAMSSVKQSAGSAVDTVKNAAGSAAHAAGSAVDSVKSTAADLAHRAGDQATHLADMAGQRYNQAAEMAGQRYNQAADMGREGYHYAEEKFEHTLEDNPLALGAVALAIGAAIGLSLPRTRRENQLFGDYRDQLVGQAREYAHEAIQQVHTLGERAGEEVKGQLSASANHG